MILLKLLVFVYLLCDLILQAFIVLQTIYQILST